MSTKEQMKDENVSDAELLHQYFVEGRQEAFTRIVTKYTDMVYNTCLRRTGNELDLAKDATQKVFLILAGKAGDILGQRDIAGWLYRTANYAAIAVKRKERRQKMMIENYSKSPETDGADSSIWNGAREILDEAMAKLGARYQEVLVLHYFQGRSYGDIAATMGCPEDTVRTLLQRGREKLRVRLAHMNVAVSGAVLMKGMATEGVMTAPDGLARLCAETVMKNLGSGASLVSGENGEILATMERARTMMLLKKAAVAVVLGGVVTIGGFALYQQIMSRNAVVPAAQLPPAMAPVGKDIEVIYSDDFDGKQLAPFWEIVTPASQVAVNPPRYRSKVMLTAAGADFNRRTGASYSSRVEIVSVPITYRAGDVLEVTMDYENAKQDTRSPNFFTKHNDSIANDHVGIVDGDGKDFAARKLCQEGKVQDSGSGGVFSEDDKTLAVFYLHGDDRLLLLYNNKAVLFESERKFSTMRLRARLDITHALGKGNLSIERILVRRLKELPKEIEARVKAMTTKAGVSNAGA